MKKKHGQEHHVKLGKNTKVKIGPSYKKQKMAQDLYKKTGVEAQN